MELNLDFLRNLRIIIGFKFKFAEREVFLLPDWESLVKLLKRDILELVLHKILLSPPPLPPPPLPVL